MKYGTIPYVDKPVSRLVFGTATKAMFDAFRSTHGAEADFPERLDSAFKLLDDMYALGVNTFDCAHHYGEEPLGEWIERRGLRDNVVILTKGAHHNPWRKRVTDFDILSDVHDSLRKLRTEYIDIYVLHRDDPDVPVDGIVEVLNRLHDEGKIGAFGGSNWSVARIQQANDYAQKRGLIPFAVSSPNFCLADQLGDPWGGGCETLSGPARAADRRWYAEANMPILAYSTMARGFFSGLLDSSAPEKAAAVLDDAGIKGYCFPENFERLRRCEQLAAETGLTVPQIAMAWLFNQRHLDVYALTSPIDKPQMEDNIASSALELTDAQCRWLNLEN